jgi:hypothetical protein
LHFDKPLLFLAGVFADLHAADEKAFFLGGSHQTQPSTHHQIAAGGKSDKIMAKPLRPKGSSTEHSREELLPQLRPAHASNAE